MWSFSRGEKLIIQEKETFAKTKVQIESTRKLLGRLKRHEGMGMEGKLRK